MKQNFLDIVVPTSLGLNLTDFINHDTVHIFLNAIAAIVAFIFIEAGKYFIAKIKNAQIEKEIEKERLQDELDNLKKDNNDTQS